MGQPHRDGPLQCVSLCSHIGRYCSGVVRVNLNFVVGYAAGTLGVILAYFPRFIASVRFAQYASSEHQVQATQDVTCPFAKEVELYKAGTCIWGLGFGFGGYLVGSRVPCSYYGQ